MWTFSKSPKRTRTRAIFAVAVVLLGTLVLITSLYDARSPRSERQALAARGSAASTDTGSRAVSTADEAAASSSDAEVELAVRDLWDCSPIPRLSLHATLIDASILPLISDAQGVIPVGKKALDQIETLCAETRDFIVASTAADVRVRKEVWCYRVGPVHGRVVFEGGQSGEFDDVVLSFSPRYLRADKLSMNEPGLFGWAKRSATISTNLGTPEKDGSFRFDIARIQSAAIVARAPGWRPAWAELDAAFAIPPQEILLALRPGLRIEGMLRDERGVPLTRQRVHVYVVRKTAHDDLETEAIGRLKEAGFTVARSLRDNWARHKLHYSSLTDEEGRWGSDIDADGEVYVVSYPLGRAPCERLIGPASRVATDVHLTAGQTSTETICVQSEGRALPQVRLRFTDISHLDFQSGFRLATDEHGFVTSTWFVPGKRYAVFVPGVGVRFFAYSGQRKIDISACERNLDRFLGRKG